MVVTVRKVILLRPELYPSSVEEREQEVVRWLTIYMNNT